MDGFLTAQICVNGHMITSSLETSPELSARFCDRCGAETISECPQCRASIRGYFHVDGVVSLNETRVRAFCHECGNPYPWTEAKLSAAREMADELDELSEEEKEQLKGTLDDLVRDTPRTEVAATRFKKLMAKVGKGAAKAMRDIVVDILSETAKKLILGS